MKIRNTTSWRTEDLRQLFSHCIRDVRKVEGTGVNRGLEVTVRNDNSHEIAISGRAYVGIYRMTIKIGNKVDFLDSRDGYKYKERLVRVFIHEYYHNLGYRSQDYRRYTADWTKDWDVGFVEDYTVARLEVKPKPRRDIQMERYEKTLKKVKEYEMKLKRAKTLLTKWRGKQRYYERILTAAGKVDGVKDK